MAEGRGSRKHAFHPRTLGGPPSAESGFSGGSHPPPRDPNRIDPTLAAVREYWERHPDLRLGQVIGNCANLAGIDPYRLEDDDLVWALTNPEGIQRLGRNRR